MNVVQVGIGELTKELVDAEIKVGGRAPKRPALLAELLEEPECMELTVFLDHGNKLRTWQRAVKPLYFADVRPLHLQADMGRTRQALSADARSARQKYPSQLQRMPYGSGGHDRRGRRQT
jgi:hypothetical protein